MIDFSLQWHITQKCGNHCLHCYMDDTSYDLTFEDYIVCIENIQKFETKYDFNVSAVSLTGGDPLLNSNWYHIAKDLVARGKKVSFLGNPELLSEDNLVKLSMLPTIRYQLSIDGMQKTHDYIRSSGSFERTIEGIRKLDAYGIPIGIMFTLSDVNASELFDVIYFLDGLQIKLVFAFDFVITTGNAKKNQMRNTKDVLRLYDDYLKLKTTLIKKGSKVLLTEKASTLWVHRNRERISDAVLKNIPFSMCGGCGAGWRHLTIIKKGEVLVCRRMPVKVGNLLTDSFEEILLHSPFLKEFRNFLSAGKCSTCVFCRFCRGCPAETYAHYNVAFLEDTECPWYVESEISSEDISGEFERISNTVFNKSMIAQCYENNDFIKAMIILNSKAEQESLYSDAVKWKKRHSLTLCDNEIGMLICIFLESNGR